MKKSARNEQVSQLGGWLTFSGFALLLGILIILCFPQVVCGFETFVTRDFGHFAYPLAFYQRQCFWRGEVPLWNPYNNCGVPFLAQWNTMPLYPPALIYLVLPLSWSLSFFCLLHLWFGGLGMYWLALKWSDNRVGAAFAGLVFAFNGLAISSLMWPSNLATLSWMPWVVGLSEHGWRVGGRKMIYAALVGAMQVLAGGPETIALTWLIVAAVLAADLFELRALHSAKPAASPSSPSAINTPSPTNGWPSMQSTAARYALHLVVIIFIMTVLCAAQLLPTLDLIAHSQREKGYGDMDWAMPPSGWVNFFVPLAFTRRWIEGIFFQIGQGWLASFYVGTLATVLALLCLGQRSARIWALAVVSAGAYLCSLGANTPVLIWLRQVVPVVSLIRYPIKFVIVIVFAVPLLAALALARLMSGDEQESRRRQKQLLLAGGLVLGVIGVVLVWVWSSELPGGTSPAIVNGLARAGFLVGTMVMLILFLRNRVARTRRMILALLFLSLWLDLWTHAPRLSSTIPRSAYAPGIVKESLALAPEPALGKSRVMISPYADQSLDRLPGQDVQQGFLTRRLGYFSNLNLLDGAPKVDGLLPLYPREIEKVVSLLYSSTNASFPRLADFLGVSHTTAPGEFTEWQRRDTFRPIVTAGQQAVFLDDAETLKRITRPDFDGSSVVLLSAEAQPQLSPRTGTSASVELESFESHEVKVKVKASAPSVAVIAQTYYHCWRAYVDGRPQPLLRANLAFQAVPVDAGEYEVQLRYEDRAFRWGAGISFATLVGCGVGLIWRRSVKT